MPCSLLNGNFAGEGNQTQKSAGFFIRPVRQTKDENQAWCWRRGRGGGHNGAWSVLRLQDRPHRLRWVRFGYSIRKRPSCSSTSISSPFLNLLLSVSRLAPLRRRCPCGPHRQTNRGSPPSDQRSPPSTRPLRITEPQGRWWAAERRRHLRRHPCQPRRRRKVHLRPTESTPQRRAARAG